MAKSQATKPTSLSTANFGNKFEIWHSNNWKKTASKPKNWQKLEAMVHFKKMTTHRKLINKIKL